MAACWPGLVDRRRRSSPRIGASSDSASRDVSKGCRGADAWQRSSSSSGDSHFQGVEKVWRTVRAAAGFPTLRLHDLRHSLASVALALGDALPVIGAILGHADVKTTSRYAHLADDPVKKAADDIAKSVQGAFSAHTAAEVVELPSGKRRK